MDDAESVGPSSLSSSPEDGASVALGDSLLSSARRSLI